MIIDQAEINALLSQADGLTTEAAAPPPPPPEACRFADDPELQRVLRLRVPVIVQLARRPMLIAAVRDLSVGAIIEFEKSVEEPLDLMVNNRLIGHGMCIKVGENFGLRITQVCDQAQRIRSLGPE